RDAGADPDGHEPAGSRRLGGDAPDQGGPGDARHSGDRAHRARDVRRSREGPRCRLRRLRYQARRLRPAGREDRSAARAAGRHVSLAPAAQLRHELRTPLNHIIGYTELLLEELADGGKPELTVGLAALRIDARQLLALLNEVLARGHAGHPDLAAARGTLSAPLVRIRSAGGAGLPPAAHLERAGRLPRRWRIGTAAQSVPRVL